MRYLGGFLFLLVGVAFFSCNKKVDFPLPSGNINYPEALSNLIQARCTRCHGLGASGGTITIRDILDEEEMIRSGIVRPGDAENSPMYTSLIRQNPMPLGDNPLNDNEKQLFFDYIQNLSEDGNVGERPFTPLETVLREIYLDLKRVNKFERDDTRYLLAVGYGDRIRIRLALNKALNSIHFDVKLTVVAAVGSIEAYRISLSDFQLSEDDWDDLLIKAQYGYYIEYDPDDEPEIVFYDEQIKLLTENEKTVSYIRADWFIFQILQPPFYYEFLGIPETETELLAILNEINEKEQIEDGKAIRSGIRESNVANFNRVADVFLLEYNIPPFQIDTAYWRTYDFANTANEKNVFVNPFGPPDFLKDFVKTEREFFHDAGEVIFGLPNGLSGYALFDAAGKRIDEVDPAIATDKLNFGINYLGAGAGSIVNAISCMGCHAGGLNIYRDQLKNQILNTGNFNLEETLFARDFFFDQNDLQQALSNYNEVFLGSQENMGISEGRYLVQSGEPTYITVRQYRNYVSACELATELYLECDDFKFRLVHAGGLAQSLGFDEQGNGKSNRDDVERLWPVIVKDLQIGTQKLFEEDTVVIPPPMCEVEIWNLSKWSLRFNLQNDKGNFIYRNKVLYPLQFVQRKDLQYKFQVTMFLRRADGSYQTRIMIAEPCSNFQVVTMFNQQEVMVNVPIKSDADSG